ncbi:extracellular solute-binding protein [Halorarum halophilum]|uniref:Extracellular solute-binding protein n=1 Tax=Halorarum halophilum TaxID=2743090 RepID=A0A7D5GA50_9EURY|nr:extracellular solute-binding protein [Halobaculum halophilum]QLG26165.1 extracellular solute-binding protein [Halobaculum halophilum]
MTDGAPNSDADAGCVGRADPVGTVRRSRRRFLAAAGAAGTAGLAGCSSGSPFGSSTETPGEVSFSDFRGSGPLVESRPPLEGTRIEDLPELSGELDVYLGGGESGLYRDLVSLFEGIYPDFTGRIRAYGAAEAANTIVTEGESTPADVFWSVDAGSLGAVAAEGLTATLPDEVVEPVPDTFHPDGQWVGTAGRARAVPYNTDQLSADQIPDTVMDFPGAAPLGGAMGWAPTYGAFQAFVTAMRVLVGRDRTERWLRGMLDAGVSEYQDEFLVSNAVAEGEIAAGFANHYYALRVRSSRPDAPLDLAFTSGDAGALINVAGAAQLAPSDDEELARNFIRHLLSAEAQEFFATRTYAYPTIPGIPPVGGLPTIDELDPPELDLTELSDVQPTLELLRETGVL